VLGADVETVRDVALAILVGAVVLAVVVAVVVKWIAAKLIVVALLAVVAVVVWQQRGALGDCAGDLRRTLLDGAADSTTCTFLGRDVTVDSPRG
jgi:hypothetical protein